VSGVTPDAVRVVAVTTGTSVDALDVVAVEVAVVGDRVHLTPLGATEVALPAELRRAVLDVLPPATTTAAAVCRLDAELGAAMADAARTGIARLADGRADLVTVRGQTIHHDVVPTADGAGWGRVRGTLQVGQAAPIAEATGLPVISDLRTRDVAAGGQGAPLVSYLDTLLLTQLGVREGTAGAVGLCNLGGIANLTIVPATGVPIAFDAGPANALLDVEARRSLGTDRDDDGASAAAGRVDGALLAVLLDDPFLAAPAPKSTGKERYHLAALDTALAAAPVGDVADRLATLTEAVAIAVADHTARHGVTRVWGSGGGVHNRHLVARVTHHLAVRGATWATTDELGLPADAKEAYAIALLGWATWLGTPATVPSCTGARGPRILGSVTPGAGPLRTPPPLATPPRGLVVAPAVRRTPSCDGRERSAGGRPEVRP
jgi:anhydro-N-acetylmuramic acid kinase